MNFVQRVLRSLYKTIGYLFSILWHTAGYQNQVLVDTENDENLSRSSTEDSESDDYLTSPTTEDLEDDDSPTISSTTEESLNVDNFTRSSTAEDAENEDNSTRSPTLEIMESDDNSTRSISAQDAESGDNFSRSTTEHAESDNNSTSLTTGDLENNGRPTTFFTLNSENEDSSTTSSTTENDDNSPRSPTSEILENDDNSPRSHTSQITENDDNSTRSPTSEITENDDNSTRSPTSETMENDDNSLRSPTSETMENDDNSTRLASENLQSPHLEIDSYEYYRSVNSGLLDALTECSICLEPLQRGARACTRCGGMWCCQCASELRTCVWCRYELDDQQSSVCHALDKLLASLKLPCRNQRNGCPKMLTLAERKSHERQYCEKEPVFCPFTIACQGLNFGEIADHMRDIHNAIVVNSLTVTINVNIIPNEVLNFDTAYALIYKKNVFILKFYCHENRVKIDVVRKSLSDRTNTDTGSRYFANIYVTQGVWSWEILDRALEPVKHTTITALLCVDLSRRRMYTICFEIKDLDM